MKHDDTHFDSTHPFEPGLEARVVAWVLGEASPFEAAELERRCAAEPELAVLKRRIEAVHGLLGAATRPAGPAWRLAPERRAALLEKLGEGASAGGLAAGGAGVADAARVLVMPTVTRRTGGWKAWALPTAACLALGGLLAAVLSRNVGASFSATPASRTSLALETSVSGSGSASYGLFADGPGGVSEPEDAKPMVMKSRFAGGAVSAPVASAAPAPVMALPATPSVPQASLDERAQLGAKREDADKVAEGRKRLVSTGGVVVSQFENKVLSGADVYTPPQAKDQAAASPELLGSADGLSFRAVRRAQPQEMPAAEPPAVFSSTLSAAGEESRAGYALGGKLVAANGAASGRVSVTAGELSLNQPLVPQQQAPAEERAKGLRGLGEMEKLKEADMPALRLATGVAAADESLRAEVAAQDEAVSTFSLHVGDASFRLAKAALERGEAPDPAAIRPEEFYNAFDYGDPAPAAGEPVSCRVEQAAHPFLQQRNLVRVALRVPAAGRGAGMPLRLTVLLDTSGSMEREDRAATVRAALASLAGLLGPADRVTLIGFARQPRLLAESLPGDQAGQLAELAGRTPAEGGTNLEEALKLAGGLARRQWQAGAQNRIVLLTDGAANLGDAEPARLAEQIEALRRQGVAFDACGVGAAGLDDGVLEALTRKGDGRYQVLNAPEEADAGFARKLAGAFRPAAENVKVQVRFNPARVARYRLIGFEQHRLREQDFKDDRVDAAELAAEEAAVALYQVEPVPGADLGELGEVAVRFRDPAKGTMVERTWTLVYEAQPPAFDRASPSLRLAGAAALLAEKLRGGAPAGPIRLDELSPAVAGLRGDYAGDPRVADFLRMFDQARRLIGE